MKERLGAKGSVNALKGAFKMLGGNDGKLEVDELFEFVTGRQNALRVRDTIGSNVNDGAHRTRDVAWGNHIFAHTGGAGWHGFVPILSVDETIGGIVELPHGMNFENPPLVPHGVFDILEPKADSKQA